MLCGSTLDAVGYNTHQLFLSTAASYIVPVEVIWQDDKALCCCRCALCCAADVCHGEFTQQQWLFARIQNMKRAQCTRLDISKNHRGAQLSPVTVLLGLGLAILATRAQLYGVRGAVFCYRPVGWSWVSRLGSGSSA